MLQGECLHTLRDHTDEVLDVAFSLSGLLVCSASADGRAFVYETADWTVVSNLTGHEGEISQVMSSHRGTKRPYSYL